MTNVLILGNVSYHNGYIKPAGMFRIASELRKQGYKTQCIDLFSFFLDKQLYQLLAKYISNETLYVGFSSTLMHNPLNKNYFSITDEQFFNVCEYIRKLNKNIKIVIGGSQALPCFNNDHIRYKQYVDFFISGQGEPQAVALAKHLQNNVPINYQTINGIKYLKSDDYEYKEFNKSEIIYSDNDVVFPEEALPIEISRGCSFKCAYCRYDNNGKQFGDMIKTRETITNELIRNYELYGTTTYTIMDDTLNDSIQKIKYLHNIFTSLPFKINFVSYARLDMIHKYPEMAILFKEMGMVGVSFGIETMHQEAGRYIGKGLGERKIKDTLTICKEAWGDSIILNANFIIGLPLEPISSIINTMDWLESNDCAIDSVNLFPLNISRTRNISMFDQGKSKNITLGFSDCTDLEWKHEHSTYSSALALAVHYERKMKSKWPIHNTVNGFTIPRLVNIGFSIEDCLTINKQHRSSSSFVKLHNGQTIHLHQEIKKRTLERRKKYQNALLRS